MIKMLAVRSGMRIMEPSAGDGVFIDPIVDSTLDVQIDAYDLNPVAIGILKEKFSNKANVHIKHSDTIIDDELTLFAQMGGIYDGIIGNPPYGAWQDYDKRKSLKRIYSDIYVKETYALFPSSFFPHVNFGYANLSIITLEKTFSKENCLNNVFTILSDFKRVEELEVPEKCSHKAIFTQKDVYTHPDYAFFPSDSAVSRLINSCQLKIGDVADCVTGIYSGNDTKYLRPISSKIRNSKKYLLLGKEFVFPDVTQGSDFLDGIKAPECFIPIVKGGAMKYLKPDNWYIDWSLDAVQDYKKNKKARFQNPSFYFKYGIGVPMVSSTQVTASLIESRIFDQSIVGIFPHDLGLMYYLLAFFNSPTCNKLLRTINPSANNSANYIKKCLSLRLIAR